jgi:hypothetical protein
MKTDYDENDENNIYLPERDLYVPWGNYYLLLVDISRIEENRKSDPSKFVKMLKSHERFFLELT